MKNMTTENIVDKAIEKTIREVVAKTYGPILSDVDKHADDENLEKIAMQSVASHFIEVLNVDSVRPQPEQKTEQSPVRPVQMPKRGEQQPTVSGGLIIATVLAITIALIMIFITPLPFEG